MSDRGRFPRLPEPPAGRPDCAADPDTPGFRVEGLGTEGAVAVFVGFVKPSGWGETYRSCSRNLG